MRSSKVKRQEERRSKLKKFRRSEKPEKVQELYTVARIDDVRQSKYLYCDNEGFEGYALEHAERLAAPVPGQAVKYTVVPLEVHRWARSTGTPLTVSEAVKGYEEEQA
jgi:hypothetical protein